MAMRRRRSRRRVPPSQLATLTSSEPSCSSTSPLLTRIQPLAARSSVDLPEPTAHHRGDDLAALDPQAGIEHAHVDPELAGDVRASGAVAQRLPGLSQIALAGAILREQDADLPELERRAHEALSAGRLMRSMMIASSTMANPASKPMPTCTVPRARTTGTPRPPAPTSAAMTTIDRLSMMH